MTVPYYVSPEQQMKDRAEFARAGIARGRSVVVLRYADGMCFVAENRSRSLHKIAEIYDRIGFAAVGRYNEFENLRIAGVRHADLRGYSYDRKDVTARSLTNAYAQLLGNIFSSANDKPYEVELVVAEIGEQPESDHIYRLSFDGSVTDEQDFTVMGGHADTSADSMRRNFQQDMDLPTAIDVAQRALAVNHPTDIADLEVAVLDRNRRQSRKFRRIPLAELRQLAEG